MIATLAYLCVLICEIFIDLPINNTNITGIALENFNTNKSEKLGFISPFGLLENLCNTCYTDWETSYVENASLYTSFLLYTKDSGENYNVVDVGNTELLYAAGFNSSKSTKLLIHGWTDNGSNYFAEEVRKAYLASEDVNIVSVSWPKLAGNLYYPLARSAVTPVGRFVATFVDFLILDVGISSDSLHLVGHSLGAHICGVVGENVKSGNLSRISGLDPAGPLFGSSPIGRLDASDARFVDVIHTTGGYLGYYNPCGTADFYPNGGVPIQPGCGLDVGFCSHERAYEFFSESISSCGFISTLCSSWSHYKKGLCVNNTKTVMGDQVSLSANGTYYLHTNDKSPFAAWNDTDTRELQKRVKRRRTHKKTKKLQKSV